MADPEQFALLEELRAARDEYDAAVDAVLGLAHVRGQADQAFPLVIRSGDLELAGAVKREIDAMERMRSVMHRLIATDSI